MTAAIQWTGKAPASQPKVTPELLALMVELLPTVGSLRDLCAITGLRLDTVRQAVAPFLAIMKLQGTHPQCGCGRDRFHPYGCKDSFAKANHADHVPGVPLADMPRVLATRRKVIELLVAGLRYVDINELMGFPHKTARHYMRFLTPEQIEERERAIELRGPISPNRRGGKSKTAKAIKLKSEPVRPFRDALYARIASAVPRNMSDATRDDIISEIYLAVSEGTLSEDDIEANARRFSNAAIGMWESKFGPRSIDVPMFEDGTATLADLLPDPAALAAFATLDEMQAGMASWRKAA